MSLYVYAVLGTPPRRPPGRGLRREPLRVLPVAGVFVAAGDVASPPAPDEAALRGHDAVVRRLARTVNAVLPVRFGTVASDASALSSLLQPRAAELRAALTLVAGREQMTLRLYGRPARAADARPVPRPEPRDAGLGARYLAARRRAHTRRASAPELDPARPALAAFVRAERVERHDAAPLLASVYHLVERGRSRAYRAALARAVARLPGIRVRPSGPWPAYAFAPDWS